MTIGAVRASLPPISPPLLTPAPRVARPHSIPDLDDIGANPAAGRNRGWWSQLQPAVRETLLGTSLTNRLAVAPGLAVTVVRENVTRLQTPWYPLHAVRQPSLKMHPEWTWKANFDIVTGEG